VGDDGQRLMLQPLLAWDACANTERHPRYSFGVLAAHSECATRHAIEISLALLTSQIVHVLGQSSFMAATGIAIPIAKKQRCQSLTWASGLQNSPATWSGIVRRVHYCASAAIASLPCGSARPASIRIKSPDSRSSRVRSATQRLGRPRRHREHGYGFHDTLRLT
jgi:hypothetical protein